MDLDLDGTVAVVTGDVVGLAGRQEGDKCGDLFWCGEAGPRVS
jgi:hypothetical protein